MFITREKVDEILSIVPPGAKACYTGQSILAYCPNPTFSWEEINGWENQTDIDIFVYSHTAHATLVQAFGDRGFLPPNPIEDFKADRIRFWEPNKKFNLQTVKLEKEGYPVVNISWRMGVESSHDCILTFDMDYLMVAMDLRTGVFADLRGDNHRVAHVNQYNTRFDPADTEPSYWYRQFERVPKGYSRGIDTRPVARQYIKWIEGNLAIGDSSIHSKTREYADRDMADAIGTLVSTGIPQHQATAFYHLCRGEMNTWDAQSMKHQAMLDRIRLWLSSVEND